MLPLLSSFTGSLASDQGLTEDTQVISKNQGSNCSYDDQVKFRIAIESAEKVDIMIYDLAGYYIKKIDFENPIKGAIEEKVWNVEDVEPGVYFANVTAWKDENSETLILKVAVVH